MNGSDRELAAAAAGVLLDNWTGGYTVPSRTLYPHQWSWDSAFICVGLRHLSPRRAQRELETLLSAQWTDGRVPHIVFNPAVRAAAYFPGANFWRSPVAPATSTAATSGIVQPPVHALAAWETFLADPGEARRRGFLERVYPRLLAWHHYLAGPRGAGDLVAIVHPWESGMDNSPSWDDPLRRIPPVPPDGFQRRDLEHAAAPERPTDADYGRYVRLAAAYRDSGYCDRLASTPFAVVDPLVNSVFAASEDALAEIAAQLGADPAPHRVRGCRVVSALVSELFDPAEGIFFARDLITGGLLRHRTVGGLAPLLLPSLPGSGALVKTALSEHFGLGRTPVVPSYDLTGQRFEPRGYWRGPGWFNTGWLLWRGLVGHGELAHAGELRRTMLETARRTGFREYVDPVSGRGCGARDFSWTAAVVLDLLANPAPAGAR